MIRRIRIVLLTLGIAVGLSVITGALPAKGAEITHNDRAYLMAARAITLESAQHEFPRNWFENAFLYGAPVYKPGKFVGLEWLCDPLVGQYGDHETCFAGLRYDGKGRRLLTGP